MMGGFYQRADCCGLWQAHGGEGCRNCPCPPPSQTNEQRAYYTQPVYIGAPMGTAAEHRSNGQQKLDQLQRERNALQREKAAASPAPISLEARANHIAEEAQGTGCWHIVRDRALHHLREVEALARRTPGRTDASARREYGDDGGAGCVG